MKGLKKVAGETKSLRGFYDSIYLQLCYDKACDDVDHEAYNGEQRNNGVDRHYHRSGDKHGKGACGNASNARGLAPFGCI